MKAQVFTVSLAALQSPIVSLHEMCGVPGFRAGKGVADQVVELHVYREFTTDVQIGPRRG